MAGILIAWLVETGIVMYRDISKGNPPLPADILAPFIVMGTLGTIALYRPAQTFATVTAWGVVGATLLNFWNPSSPLSIGKVSKPNPSTATSGGGGKATKHSVL
jgi:hypothetical protein